MTETAREAVARAICFAGKLDSCGCKNAAACGNWRAFEDEADDAVAAHLAWLDAHGWQIVPKEPTPDMVNRGHDIAPGAREHYRAMLAAAPKPPGD